MSSIPLSTRPPSSTLDQICTCGFVDLVKSHTWMSGALAVRRVQKALAKAEINIPRVPKATADNMRAQEDANEKTKNCH